MNKQIKHTYGGMTKDISKSRFPNSSYFDGQNFNITATDNQSSYSISNEKGTIVQITFPDYIVNSNNILISNQTIPYTVKDIPLGNHTDHKLVGSINIKDGIIFFTTGTIDSIWLHDFKDDNNIKLIYARELGFSQDYQITGISNYENEKIEKIYWVDGLHQIRHLNIRHSKDNGDYENLIDIPTDTIEMVNKFNLSQPIIKELLTGGSHTAGMIQYAYSLYKINGNSTNTSPLSKLIPLTNGAHGGGGVNEYVKTTPVVRIEQIDPNYTNIIVYSIKYTSYQQLPEINIIYDQQIPDNKNVEIFDDGSIINNISIEEFILRGQDIKIPKHIEAKDNRLFVSNYLENNFNVNLDLRAYSFNTSNINTAVSRVYSDVESLDDLNNTPVRIIKPNAFPDDPEDTFDNINLDFDTYKYSLSFENSDINAKPTIGGTNNYLTYEIIQTNGYDPQNKYFKDQEIYRIGIEFYNEYGVNTKPMWIADFKAPEGNLTGARNTLRFKWKPYFYDWLNNTQFTNYNKPVGYKLLIAERGYDDRTIITSGVVSTMMFNTGNAIEVNSDSFFNSAAVEDRSTKVAKIPSWTIRNLGIPPVNAYPTDINLKFSNYVQHNLPLEYPGWTSGSAEYRGESVTSEDNVYSDNGNNRLFVNNIQYTKMLQLFSPDTVFNQNVNLTANLKMKVKGLIKNTENKIWSQEVGVNDGRIILDGVGNGGLSIATIALLSPEDVQMTEGDGLSLHDFGIIAHPGGTDANVYSRNLWYRKYGNMEVTDLSNNVYNHALGNNIFDIMGSAEYSLRGQSFTTYSKNPDYRYSNNLSSFKGFSQRRTNPSSNNAWDDMGIYNRRIVSINSDATGNITIVPMVNGNSVKLEDIYNNLVVSGSKITDCIPYVELIKSRESIYLGGIYGGNSFEDKKRTKYVGIGDYNKIEKNSTYIESPGDTFVQNFRFLRICRSEESIINQGTYHITEIVEFPVETTIDLNNRNDMSLQPWDSKITYSFDDYHKYNRVYSQKDNLKVNIDNEYNVKEVKLHETNIIASKLKTSGELIDNWLTLLPNESIDLDGKFGPITNLILLNDELYTLQDRAFSKLSINPRVQVQGNDGVSIELGSGTVLQDYQYISTEVGCKNKHGSIVTPYGIYFYDTNNKRINQFNGQITPISETAGLHSFLYSKELKSIDLDKPLKGEGISMGYDYTNNQLHMSFLTLNENFTLKYTEKGNMFVNNNDYGANHYSGMADYFYSNLSDNQMYRHNKGEYNNYYGENKPTKVTLLINPEADLSIVVNNIAFKSEAYLNSVDQPNTTLTHIRAYNEYQDSGLVPLTTNRRGNIKRLFREWNAQVPRDEGKRDRIRNPWTYLELTFDNPGNIEFILHDMIVSYTV